MNHLEMFRMVCNNCNYCKNFLDNNCVSLFPISPNPAVENSALLLTHPELPCVDVRMYGA